MSLVRLLLGDEEVLVRAAEEVATAFALNHGQAVARLPGARLAGDA
jgi:hypothetical protein